MQELDPEQCAAHLSGIIKHSHFHARHTYHARNARKGRLKKFQGRLCVCVCVCACVKTAWDDEGKMRSRCCCTHLSGCPSMHFPKFNFKSPCERMKFFRSRDSSATDKSHGEGDQKFTIAIYIMVAMGAAHAFS